MAPTVVIRSRQKPALNARTIVLEVILYPAYIRLVTSITRRLHPVHSLVV
jgi:hypothetical protein